MKKKNKDLIEVIKEIDNHSGSDLRGEKLSCLDLQDKDFSKCDLSKVNFSMSNLCGSDFSSAKLDQTDLRGANLYGCHWEGSSRNGYQIIKAASIVFNQTSIYGFLCQKGNTRVVLLNEDNRPEIEFAMQNATALGRLLNNLLLNG